MVSGTVRGAQWAGWSAIRTAPLRTAHCALPTAHEMQPAPKLLHSVFMGRDAPRRRPPDPPGRSGRRPSRPRGRQLALHGSWAAAGTGHPLPASGHRAAADQLGRLAGRCRSWSRARPPTATASSSTRTTSTTTTARTAASATRTTRAAAAGTSSDLFSAPDGTYTYPTDPAYASNAADLVEFRVKPLADSTAFRLTLNSMKDPSLVGTTIAIGRHGRRRALRCPTARTSTAPGRPVPDRSRHHAPTSLHAGTNALAGPAPTVTVDHDPPPDRGARAARPHWDPTGKVVRLAAAVGLWDSAGDTYLLPQQDADATHPGGSGALAAPPRLLQRRLPRRRQEPTRAHERPAATPRTPAWWRDQAQGQALAARAERHRRSSRTSTSPSSPRAPTTTAGVPKAGPMDRILASHFETEQGADYSTPCADAEGAARASYRGRLQPYAIYVPQEAAPRPPATG